MMVRRSFLTSAFGVLTGVFDLAGLKATAAATPSDNVIVRSPVRKLTFAVSADGRRSFSSDTGLSVWPRDFAESLLGRRFPAGGGLTPITEAEGRRLNAAAGRRPR